MTLKHKSSPNKLKIKIITKIMKMKTKAQCSYEKMINL